MDARHSAMAHAAYHDLLRILREEQVSNLRGSPTKVVRGKRAYWYDSYRVGDVVKKTYIGEDSAELRDMLAREEEIKARIKEGRGQAARLVRILRAEGFMSLDAGTGRLLSAMAGAGVFRLGGTLIGTHAFRLYEGELGLRYRFDQMAQTGDVDIASFERLSLALNDRVEPPMDAVFKDLDFEPVPALNNAPAWRWRQSRGDTLVEFLTPSFGEEGPRPLAALGVTAHGLHHLNYLLAEPIQAVVLYRAGVLVQIPRPERFAIHKLIVADRRAGRDRLKSEKDRMQAAFLIKALAEDRPDDLAEAYADAMGRGSKWQERIGATLERMPEVAEVLG